MLRHAHLTRAGEQTLGFNACSSVFRCERKRKRRYLKVEGRIRTYLKHIIFVLVR